MAEKMAKLQKLRGSARLKPFAQVLRQCMEIWVRGKYKIQFEFCCRLLPPLLQMNDRIQLQLLLSPPKQVHAITLPGSTLVRYHRL